jgi:hypothetical protein
VRQKDVHNNTGIERGYDFCCRAPITTRNKAESGEDV